ncbi:hypothetical protein [Maritalea porphyrae]|uniref:hypothetical protein n=1 Tax=Maritalea porphyrae TaxID=880732 RepID=UPI0022AF750D|nr:hypothetical protein [Maritalea porphyrae]MCZ4270888.1 hypothetical protein [Maritalea porphyrae]
MSFKIGESKTSTSQQYSPQVEAMMDEYQKKVGSTAQHYWNLGGMPVPPKTDRQNATRALVDGIGSNTGHDYTSEIAAAGGGYTPSTAQAHTVDGEQIIEGMNPYLEGVGRDTINTMRRERDNTDAKIGARHASAVAFGGSGSALERAQLNRGYGENVGKAINGIMAQGYDNSTNLALNNAQMKNQADLANAQMANEAARFGASNNLNSKIAASQAVNDQHGRKINAFGAMERQNIFDLAQNQEEQNRLLNLLDWTQGKLPTPGVTQTSTKPLNFNPLAVLGSML